MMEERESGTDSEAPHGDVVSREVINRRKEKIKKFFKWRFDLITYFFLAIILWIGVVIRSGNLKGLKDVTTGTWTLGPDLDPFLFLRYAKEIVETGTLAIVDMMRYVPLGFQTNEGYRLHYYLIAWFHQFLGPIFGTESVTHSAVLFPVFMFALTVVAFFFLSREIFVKSLGKRKANIIGLISSFFLTVIPVLLPRTIAGIPEKESAAFFFMFAALYFFAKAWNSDKFNRSVLFGLLAGIFTGAMAHIWGGFAYIFTILGPAVLVSFLFGNINKNKSYAYFIWIFSSSIIMIIYAPRYSLTNIIASTTTIPAFFTLFVLVMHPIFQNTKIKKYFKGEKLRKIPPKILSLLISIIILSVLVSVFISPSFIPSELKDISHNLIKPAQSRLIQTVAENRQPHFSEWANNFGPQIKGLPITFWLFFVGSVFLFNFMVKSFNKKERIVLTTSYLIFLISVIFSRYSGNSIFNGENFASLFLYSLGFIIFIGTVGNYYFKYYKNGKIDELRNIDFGLILLFVFFFLAIVSARGAIRLVMVVVPPASIIIGYFSVSLFYSAKKSLNKEYKVLVWIVAGIVILTTVFAGYNLYREVKFVGESYIPSQYTQQWQKAMSWTRENTPDDAVFGHWWDYGYWVQSIGERATVLDGGNSVSYWNHLMGRYGLTGYDQRKTLEFLYAHNVTHFLIDSTDIGKYSAFSTIGSDENYDRQSWIPTFIRDENQRTERKNSTIEVYTGGSSVDEDISYTIGEDKIFLPKNRAAIGGVILERDSNNEIVSINGIFFDKGNQFSIPLRYYYDGRLVDTGKGLEAGVFIFPKINELPGGQVNLDDKGAMLYLSKRVVNTRLARYYIFGEEDEFFELAHLEKNFIIENLESQGLQIGDFAYFRGLQGPIKIWKINYPDNIEFKKEFVETVYPKSLRNA